LLETILAFIGGCLAGAFGFAQFLIKRHDEKQNEMKELSAKVDKLTELVEAESLAQKDMQQEIRWHGDAIAGLEHDRIIHVGEGFIQKGKITLSEYDDINKYLYEPYKKLGGNGTAEDVMDRLKELVHE
jgi:hypothetical protein